MWAKYDSLKPKVLSAATMLVFALAITPVRAESDRHRHMGDRSSHQFGLSGYSSDAHHDAATDAMHHPGVPHHDSQSAYGSQRVIMMSPGPVYGFLNFAEHCRQYFNKNEGVFCATPPYVLPFGERCRHYVMKKDSVYCVTPYGSFLVQSRER